jgi:tRNA(adenine34) deaminase
MYVTLEPCPMCAGAIINARIEKVCFGAYDSKSGALGSVLNLFEHEFNHKPDIQGGILREECSKLLTEFFKNLRRSKK